MTTIGSAPGEVAAIPFLDLNAVSTQSRAQLDAAWQEVLRHGRFVGGPEVAAFETAFAGYCGVAGAVGVANGTDGLELVLVGMGIGPGDEVIVPANTFVATVEAVVNVGATPRFVDVLPETLLIDPAAVAAAVGPRTSAVVAVHLFGQMVDLHALLPVAERAGIAVVEDAAQAPGATFGGRRAGSVGAAAAFSFYPGKNLGALGDAGAVVSDDERLLSRIRSVANHGRSAYDRHRHDLRGRNSRLDTLQAAVLGVKLAGLDVANDRRRAAMATYRSLLPADVLPVVEHPSSRAVYHLAVVRVPDRPAAVARLSAAGIGWGIHYPVPCHFQPAFAQYRTEPLRVAEAAADAILSLPMSPSLTQAQIARVCAALATV